MRCIGTLEFLCDFHEKCQLTQVEFSLAKERSKATLKNEPDSGSESDKENVSPLRIGAKRKTARNTKTVKNSSNGKIPLTGNEAKKSNCNTAKKINISKKREDANRSPDSVELSRRNSPKTVSNGNKGTETQIGETDSSEVSSKSDKSQKENNQRSNSLPLIVADTAADIITATNTDKTEENETKSTRKLQPARSRSDTSLRSNETTSGTRTNGTNENSDDKIGRNGNRGRRSLAKRNNGSTKKGRRSIRSEIIDDVANETNGKDVKGKVGRFSIKNECHSPKTSTNGNNLAKSNKLVVVLKNNGSPDSRGMGKNGSNLTSNTKRNIDNSRIIGTRGNSVQPANDKDGLAVSKAVPVIVKKEKLDSNDDSVQVSKISKPNQLVWVPTEAMMLDPEKPVQMKSDDKPTTKSPQPGDEADADRIQGVGDSKEANVSNDSSIAKRPNSEGSVEICLVETTENLSDSNSEPQVRKSVIELLENVRTKRDLRKALENQNESDKSVADRKNVGPNASSGSKQEINGEHLSDKNSKISSTRGVRKVENFRERRRSSEGKFGRLSELISEEQKEVIETLYHVNMNVVDNDEVYKNIAVLGKMNIKCKICGMTYPRMDKCQVHIWGHLNMKPFCCKSCNFVTLTVSNIRCHIRKSHLKIKPFECHHCDKKFVTAVLLEEHINSHTGEKPYRCKLCDFSSASRQVLSYHKTTHKPVKDISCDICGKEFYSKSRMRAHMIVHNKDKSLMCKLCSSYLCNAEALERHLKKVHAQDYVCNICGKRTKSRKALHNHQNVHSAAKYKCPICPNVYKSRHILKEHILKHEGIRKYKCQLCPKSFAQQSHIAAHMSVHSAKRYPCPGCEKQFNRQDNMKMHTRRCEAFLANPELKELLTKKKSNKPTSIKDLGMDDPESANAVLSTKDANLEYKNIPTNLKTDIGKEKTDVGLSKRNSMSKIDLSNVSTLKELKSIACDDDFDRLKSNESEIIRIGEVDIFPVADSSDGRVHIEGNVTIIENVLGPECF